VVDALQPRNAVEELAHEHDDVLGPALPLGQCALQVLDPRTPQMGTLQRPAIADTLDVPV